MFLHRLAADADQNRRLASAMGRLRIVLGKRGDCRQSVGFRPKLSPRATVQMRRACRVTLDPGIIAEGAVPSPQPLDCYGCSICHSFIRVETWHASVQRRWAAETCGQQQLARWAGLALGDPSSRRRLGGWTTVRRRRKLSSSSATSDQSRGGIIHAHDPALGFSCAER